jgi:hypothetical protein
MATIAGVVLLILCGVLVFLRRSQQAKLREITSTETSTVDQVVQAAKYVAERMGKAGSFSRIVALAGVVRCENPLTSEVAQEPCVYFSTSVRREYEEAYWETDSQSKERVRKTRSGSETVHTNSQRVPFWLEDETGRIFTNPRDAEIEGVQVVNRFEAGHAMVALGKLRIDLGELIPIRDAGERRTVGYKIQESILAPERQVYVLGEVVDADGKLEIQKPREKGRKFIISVKSQAELIRSTGSAARWLLVGAAGSGALGAALLVIGLSGRG